MSQQGFSGRIYTQIYFLFQSLKHTHTHTHTPHSLSDPESTDTAPTSPPKSTPVLCNFECVCWELDPHISWLLERLGFKHAQTTIPKWIQRVAMDPLDMVVANAMELLIKITATKKLQQKSRASSPPSH